MHAGKRIAFWIYLANGVALLVFGWGYLTRQTFASYHAAVTDTPWSVYPPPQQLLMLAMMKAIGSATITVALCFLVLVAAFRRGAPWALWAVPTVGAVQALGSLYPMLYLVANTDAEPPLLGPLLTLVAMVAGLLFSLLWPAQPSSPRSRKIS
ncbi:MAG: hypothetical protein SW833_27275 [Cyanobacteriota bacterium]|nr:hypothetical protein [Cyanobacteriota bacterium]